MVKRRATVLVIAATGAMVSLIPATAQGARNRCKVAGSTTLAINGYARIYGKGLKAFACVKASGKKTMLDGAIPEGDIFSLAGRWVGWTFGVGRSNVTKMFIPDGKTHDSHMPFDTGGQVLGIVIKPDGALAWDFSSPNAHAIVQGEDRRNHDPDELSDDTRDAVGSSLKSGRRHQIHWRYATGGTGHANLY